LLQRHKNRDLFDLNQGLLQLGLDRDRVIACFQHYLALEGHPITRANAEERMLYKLNQSLTDDIAPLLPAHVTYSDEDAIAAFGRVWRDLIGHIPGDPWKLSQAVIDEIRAGAIPGLLRDDEDDGAVRRGGQLHGKLRITDDFDAPDPEIEDLFSGEEP
jgi:hypothetical protein